MPPKSPSSTPSPAKGVKKSPEKMTIRMEITSDDIRVEAYYHWIKRGCPSGDEMADWFTAEKRLLEKLKKI